MSTLKNVANRFKKRKALSRNDTEELERRQLLSTAQVITTDELHTYAGGRRLRRRRTVTPQESTPEASLCPRTAIACFDQLRRGLPFACFNRLRAELRSADLMFVVGKDELEPTSAMQSYVRQKLLPMQDEALLAYYALGVIPVRFIRNPYNDEVYPAIPKWGTYNITIQTTLGHPEFRFYWTTLCADGSVAPGYVLEEGDDNIPGIGRLVARGIYRSDGRGEACNGRGEPLLGGFGRYDPTVAVISGLGYDPDIDGTLRSIMASVLSEHINYNNTMRRDAIVAGARAARPPLATEYNPALDATMNKKALEIGHFVGSGVLAPGAQESAQRRSEIYQRTSRAEQRAQRDQLRIIAATMGEAALEQYGVTMDDIKDCDQETISEFNASLGVDEITVRDDRKLASHVPMPVVRGDIVEAMKQNDDRIAACFGLPLSALNGETAAVKTGIEMPTKIVNTTTQELLDMMSNLMTTIYNHIWLEQDIFALLDDRVRLGRGEALHSESNLFTDGAEALDVRVVYRFTPLMAMETLRFVKARGIIGFKKYATSAVKILGLKASDIESETDPFDDDTGRALDVPEYLQVMQLKSNEKLKEKELKSAHDMKDKELASAHEMKDKELDSAKELAAKEPAAKKAKSSK